MPRNPSKRQSEASRRNLRGKQGPKTSAGKSRAALNGSLNQGIKTAKARALQIAGRWGAKTETFYSYVGCVQCKKDCLWPSFSLETSLLDMPLGCLREVLEEKPNRCFYYFEGFCCGSHGVERGAGNGIVSCILDDGFAGSTMKRLGVLAGEAEKVELRERKRVWALKKEMVGYLDSLRRQGLGEAVWTPRMIYAASEMSKMLRTCGFCKLEPWRNLSSLEEVLERLYTGELPPSARGKAIDGGFDRSSTCGK
jgi:hypothetical protein